MKIIKCISGYEGYRLELLKNEMFNAALLKVNENGTLNSIYIGKAEVQELIDELEKLKNQIL